MSRHQHIDTPSDAIMVAPAVLAADNTPTVIDCRGFQAVQLRLIVGVGGITFTATDKIEFVLRHGNALSNGNAPAWSDMTAVEATDLRMPAGETLATGGIVRSLIAAHAAASSRVYHYFGNRRYLALLADFSGTHATGTPIAAIVTRLKGHLNPAV